MTGESGARAWPAPPPWYWGTDEELRTFVADAQHRYVAVMSGKGRFSDAAFISAAPDLYDALLALYEASLHTLDRAYEDVRGQVEAALQKAEGKP